MSHLNNIEWIIELRRLEASGDEQGAIKIRAQLVEANTELVWYHANRWRDIPPGLEPIDLFQSGIVGLYDGIDHFDHTKGFKFSTYVRWWIMSRIGIATRNGPIVKFTKQKPNPKGVFMSMDAVVADGSLQRHELISDESVDIKETIEHKVLCDQIYSICDHVKLQFSSRQQDIIDMRLRTKKTLSEIGEEFKISKQRVAQIEKVFMSEVRSYLEQTG